LKTVVGDTLADIPKQVVSDKLKKETLYKAIIGLKKEYRTMILLFYFENKSYKEIMVELNLTETVISQGLFRARKKLADIIQNQYEWGESL